MFDLKKKTCSFVHLIDSKLKEEKRETEKEKEKKEIETKNGKRKMENGKLEID